MRPAVGEFPTSLIAASSGVHPRLRPVRPSAPNTECLHFESRAIPAPEWRLGPGSEPSQRSALEKAIDALIA